MAREAGFANLNVDLMSGLPRQNLTSWEKSLEVIAGMEPEHISAYSLIIEEGTPFAEKKLELPDEEEERRMYERTWEILQAYGYHQYEISNYAKKGKEKILDYLNNGTEVPGFRRVSRKGTDTVAPEDVAKYATWIGVPKLLKSYGPLKADVFRALFAEALPEQQFPEELVRTGAGSSYVKKISVSKITTNK